MPFSAWADWLNKNGWVQSSYSLTWDDPSGRTYSDAEAQAIAEMKGIKSENIAAASSVYHAVVDDDGEGQIVQAAAVIGASSMIRGVVALLQTFVSNPKNWADIIMALGPILAALGLSGVGKKRVGVWYGGRLILTCENPRRAGRSPGLSRYTFRELSGAQNDDIVCV